MFQFFAAKMFEQRLLTSFREKVSREKQQSLLQELEEEEKSSARKQAKKEAKKERAREEKRKKKEEEENAIRKQEEEIARKAKEKEDKERKEKAKREAKQAKADAIKKAQQAAAAAALALKTAKAAKVAEKAKAAEANKIAKAQADAANKLSKSNSQENMSTNSIENKASSKTKKAPSTPAKKTEPSSTSKPVSVTSSLKENQKLDHNSLNHQPNPDAVPNTKNTTAQRPNISSNQQTPQPVQYSTPGQLPYHNQPAASLPYSPHSKSMLHGNHEHHHPPTPMHHHMGAVNAFGPPLTPSALLGGQIPSNGPFPGIIGQNGSSRSSQVSSPHSHAFAETPISNSASFNAAGSMPLSSITKSRSHPNSLGGEIFHPKSDRDVPPLDGAVYTGPLPAAELAPIGTRPRKSPTLFNQAPAALGGASGLWSPFPLRKLCYQTWQLLEKVGTSVPGSPGFYYVIDYLRSPGMEGITEEDLMSLGGEWKVRRAERGWCVGFTGFAIPSTVANAVWCNKANNLL